jgi:hypothetical protein
MTDVLHPASQESDAELHGVRARREKSRKTAWQVTAPTEQNPSGRKSLSHSAEREVVNRW